MMMSLPLYPAPEIRGREGKTDIEEQPKVKIKLVVFPLDGMMFEAAWKLV